MKKVIVLTLIVSLLIMSFVGCSQDEDSSGGDLINEIITNSDSKEVVYKDDETLFYCQDRSDIEGDRTVLYRYNYKGEVIQSEEAQAIGFLAPNGLAFAEDPQSGNYGFVDESGVFVIDPVFEGGGTGFAPNGLALVEFNDKFGYINSKGGVVIPFEYDYAESFTESNCAKVGVKKDGEFNEYMYGVINDKNELIVPYEYYDIVQCKEYVVCTKSVSEEKDGSTISTSITDLFNYKGKKLESFTTKEVDGVPVDGTSFYYECIKDKLFRTGFTVGDDIFDVEKTSFEIYHDGEFKNYNELYNISSKHVATTESGIAYGVQKDEDVLIPFEYDEVYYDEGYYVCIKYLYGTEEYQTFDIYDESFMKTAENIEYRNISCFDYKEIFLPKGYFYIWVDGAEDDLMGVVDYKGNIIVEPVFYRGIYVNEFAGKSDWGYDGFNTDKYKKVSDEMLKERDIAMECKATQRDIESVIESELYDLEGQRISGKIKFKSKENGGIEIVECIGLDKTEIENAIVHYEEINGTIKGCPLKSELLFEFSVSETTSPEVKCKCIKGVEKHEYNGY